MPKIRDLGISVIPATMRPPEVGDGAADFEYWAQKTGCPATDAPPQDDPPPGCRPTNKPPCNPSPPPQCAGTPKYSGKGADADPGALPDGAVMQLKQQLQQQMTQL
jgi:hypothetical protein